MIRVSEPLGALPKSRLEAWPVPEWPLFVSLCSFCMIRRGVTLWAFAFEARRVCVCVCVCV